MNSLIKENTISRRYGGAGMRIEGGNVTVMGSIFYGNQMPRYLRGQRYGSAVYVENANVKIVNSTFTKNHLPTGGASYGGIVKKRESGIVDIINSIIWNNQAVQQLDGSSSIYVTHSIIEDGTPEDSDGGGNLDVNPLFIDPMNNLKLQNGSPAINAGINEEIPADKMDLDGNGNRTEKVPFDFNGDQRIQNGTVDMGAYETVNN
jgi:hypothetical protein